MRLVLAAAAASPGCTEIGSMNVAPIVTAGSVQTTAFYISQTNGDTDHGVLQTGSISAESYIWQPWLASVRGRGNVSYELRGGDAESRSLQGSGEATLSILPVSKYPATFTFSHVDSRVDGDFVGFDFTQTRASANFRAAITQNLTGRLFASYDILKRDQNGDLNTRNLQLNLTQTFPKDETFFGLQSIGLGASYRDLSFTATTPEDSDADRTLAVLSLTMDGRPSDELTYNSTNVFNYEIQDEAEDSFDLMSVQSVSTMQWRPEEYPVVVTGTLRGLIEQIERDELSGGADSDTMLVAGTVGARWPVSDRLSFNFGLRGAYENVERGEGAALGETNLPEGQNFSAALLAGANYFSETHQVSGFDWNWNSRALLDVGMRNEDGFFTRDSVAVGHKFERGIDPFGFGPIRMTFDQELEARIDTDDDDDQFALFLSNGVGFSTSRADRTSSSSARFRLFDRRNLLDSDDEFQIAQFRWDKRMAFDRDRSLTAALTAQAVRRVDEDDTDFSLTASGNVTYQHRNVFGAENLDFLSELRLNIFDLDEIFGRREADFSSETFRNDWRNILRYRIGQLFLQTELSAFYANEGLGYLALLRLRRDFSPSE